jgi:hypothetical protein
MRPVSAQLNALKCTNDVIATIDEGIEPLIKLFDNDRLVKLPKLPISDGRVPDSPRPSILIDITLA